MAEACALEAEACKIKESIQAEFKVQVDLASEHLEKYQREVMLHAADVKTLSDLKVQFDQLTSEVVLLCAACAHSSLGSCAPPSKLSTSAARNSKPTNRALPNSVACSRTRQPSSVPACQTCPSRMSCFMRTLRP